MREGARLAMLGRRDRLPADLAAEVAEYEAASAAGRRADAAHRLRLFRPRRDRRRRPLALGAGATVEDLDRLIAGARRGGPVDLLIRTGGEKRLSDFLLWECAYAELWFTEAHVARRSRARKISAAAAAPDFGRRKRRVAA